LNKPTLSHRANKHDQEEDNFDDFDDLDDSLDYDNLDDDSSDSEAKTSVNNSDSNSKKQLELSFDKVQENDSKTLNQLKHRLTEIIVTTTKNLKSTFSNHIQQTILDLKNFKEFENIIKSIQLIPDICIDLYPVNSNDQTNTYLKERIQPLINSIYELKQSYITSHNLIEESNFQYIDQFIENTIFEFSNNTLNEIIIFHSKLPKDHQRSEAHLLNVKDSILKKAGIEIIPVEEGRTLFCSEEHVAYEECINPDYDNQIIVQVLLNGYRNARTHKILKKTGVVLNYRFD